MWYRAIGCIVTLTLNLLIALCVAHAQPGKKMWRIGVLEYTVRSLPEAFRQGLRDLGYVEGQNIVIEFRSAEGTVDRLGALATGLAHLPVDVLVAVGAAATRAAQQATRTIPIVMLSGTDVVAQGFVASLARPGGTITGLGGFQTELSGKRLEMLTEALPGVSRIAVLWNPGNLSTTPFLQETQAAAQALRVTLHVLEVRTSNDVEEAFAAILRGRAEALLVLPDRFLNSQHRRIVDFADRHRLPGMYYSRDYVDAGGLMSYAPPGLQTLLPRVVPYVDKILKGAKPADLPVERLTQVEFVTNLKTATALGLRLPPTLLIQTTEVIQ
jgi:putative ABC transport system substrate-binding protein